jgi:hypothetical protein
MNSFAWLRKVFTPVLVASPFEVPPAPGVTRLAFKWTVGLCWDAAVRTMLTEGADSFVKRHFAQSSANVQYIQMVEFRPGSIVAGCFADFDDDTDAVAFKLTHADEVEFVEYRPAQGGAA